MDSVAHGSMCRVPADGSEEHPMDLLLQDLRYALRALRRSPGFASVAILTLALGIGATTAIFSVVDKLMLRPLPYAEADRIVTIWQNNTRDGVPRDEVAPANFFDWRERATAFSVVAAADPYAYSLLNADGRPETVFAVQVTEGFFEALGVEAYRGRFFAPEHHQPGAGGSAVLTHGFWQRRFGGDPAIVGSTIPLDGEPFVVLGVLPPEFEPGLLRDVPGERSIWVARQEEGWERQARSTSGWWNVIARLEPGVSLDRARADMDRVARALAAEYPDTNEGVGATVVPLRDHLVSQARTALLVLMGAVGFVLLIACANVANLLVARATDRERDLAVRFALGADRRRLVGLLLTESLLIGLLGGAAGVAIAYGGVDVIRAIAPADVPRIETVGVDLRILGFALAVSLLAPLAFGLVPAVQAARSDLESVLKSARTTLREGRLRAGLIVGEIALALTLLIGAGLLLRSFAAILRIDPGFRTENVAALQVFAWDQNPTFEDRVRFFDETLRRIEALPGVTSAGAVGAGPFFAEDISTRGTLYVEGRPPARPGEEAEIFVNWATPGYFRTLAIPLLRGRVFEASDRRDAPRVAVINEALRRRYWPAADPVGARVRLGGDDEQLTAEIVGVVGDVRSRQLDVPPRPELYLAQAQVGSGGMTFFVATRGDAAALIEAVKREIWAVEPLQDFYQTATIEALISRTLVARRFSLALLGAFAGLALLLAAVGVYGVVSFNVNRRTHELGVRMALGACRAEISRIVLRQAMTMTLGGIALGLLGALAMARALTTLLYDVAPWDGWAFAGAGSLLAAAALLASYIPARRATRVDPVTALRAE